MSRSSRCRRLVHLWPRIPEHHCRNGRPKPAILRATFCAGGRPTPEADEKFNMLHRISVV